MSVPEPPRYRVGHDDRWRLDAYRRCCGAWVDRGLVVDSRLGRQADLGHPVDPTNTGMLLSHRLAALHVMPICGSVGLQEPGSACRRPPGSALGGWSNVALPAWTLSCQWSSAAGQHAHGMMRRFGGAQSGPSRCEVAGPGHPSWSGGPFGGGLAARCLPNKAQRNACRGRRCGRVRGGRDGAAATSSQAIVEDYLGSDATRQAAGSSEHARGPAAPPFLVGPRGEVAVRGASGPQPVCTSGVHGVYFTTLWDGGGTACGPPRGPAAALPPDPGRTLWDDGGTACGPLGNPLRRYPGSRARHCGTAAAPRVALLGGPLRRCPLTQAGAAANTLMHRLADRTGTRIPHGTLYMGTDGR